MTGLDAAPKDFERPTLVAAGYVGWQSWADLYDDAFGAVPQTPGCYVVARATSAAPEFLKKSPAGRFKDRDPTVPVSTLRQNWIPTAEVVYIGKADKLRTRLKTYARFGRGEPVAHWGGRYIWQTANAQDLLVAWRPLTGTGTARDLERKLLARFIEHHDARPFANLTG